MIERQDNYIPKPLSVEETVSAEIFEQFDRSPIKVAIQKDGGLTTISEQTLSFLVGITLNERDTKERRLIDISNANDETVGIVYARNKTICELVVDGNIDMAIVGSDRLEESKLSDKLVMANTPNRPESLWPIVLATTTQSGIQDLRQIKTVATQYPVITEKYFEQWNQPVDIIKTHGGTEAFPYLKYKGKKVDAITDLTATGVSLQSNGLIKWSPPIFIASPVIIIKPDSYPKVKEHIYKTLERRMVGYQDLIKTPTKENGEKFVVLDRIPSAYNAIQFPDMVEQFGQSIYVRESVSNNLSRAQSLLQAKNPELSLFITFGYRPLATQVRRFEEYRTKLIQTRSFQNEQELYEAVHKSIAVPEVAGHPTGGAVDVFIFNSNTGAILDFGTQQYDYSTKDYYVYSPFISKEAQLNRILLRECMIEAGFAPFDGEWWHFSYGDREWAFYYKHPSAFYEQKDYAGM